MLSKLKEKHAPFGKLVDNTKARPVYIEKKDLRGRDAAKKAFRALIEQNPNARDAKTLAVNVRDVYEIVKKAPEPRNSDSCLECGGEDDEGLVLLCEKCNAAHHAACVGFAGPLLGDWLCEACA
eukprot:5013441-Prymnesium_polylepis.1